MFGYVLPRRTSLDEEETARFRAAYCGMCHVLARRYGWLCRFLLNYDFTFLSLLLTEEDAPLCMQSRRCVASPCRGRCVCFCGGGQEEAADESVILAWWKLRDQAEDSGWLRGLPARVLSMVYRPAYRKASSLRPEFDRTVRSCLTQLRELERAGCPSLDQPADTFARILSASAAGQRDPIRRRALEQLLYHLGRWIYLVDAWDDLQEDEKRGGYNPVLLRYELAGSGDREEAARAIGVTLEHSLNLTRSAMYLLEPGPWTSLVENILCQGLPLVQQLVLTGQWKDRRKSLQREKRG